MEEKREAIAGRKGIRLAALLSSYGLVDERREYLNGGFVFSYAAM